MMVSIDHRPSTHFRKIRGGAKNNFETRQHWSAIGRLRSDAILGDIGGAGVPAVKFRKQSSFSPLRLHTSKPRTGARYSLTEKTSVKCEYPKLMCAINR